MSPKPSTKKINYRPAILKKNGHRAAKPLGKASKQKGHPVSAEDFYSGVFCSLYSF